MTFFVFMAILILVSSYAPAVSTLKLWWICNIIDLILDFPFLHQEFKTFTLYFAVFVIVTPRATVCKCRIDEKKVRGRSLLFSWKYARWISTRVQFLQGWVGYSKVQNRTSQISNGNLRLIRLSFFFLEGYGIEVQM